MIYRSTQDQQDRTRKIDKITQEPIKQVKNREQEERKTNL